MKVLVALILVHVMYYLKSSGSYLSNSVNEQTHLYLG